MNLFDQTGALFSPCRKYRYKLWRIWDFTLPPACFVLMNPSTADEVNNDPTVERQQRRVQKWKGPEVGGVIVVNVFAWRETESSKLDGLIANGTDIIGPDNDKAILEAVRESAIVVCGWGQPGNINQRGKNVLELIRSTGKIPHCLKQNKDGTPMHPLYIGYSEQPKPMINIPKFKSQK